MEYHNPVLLKESIEGLEIKQNGIYLDATFGGGGHSKEIIKEIGSKGMLIGFDQDEDVLNNLIEDDRFLFINHNFRHLKRFLKLHQIDGVDGILADLGISSHHINEATRGFSYRFDAPIDMRMNQKDEVTAATILNTYTADELQQIFSEYGEVRNSKTIANVIVEARSVKTFETINEFIRVLDPWVRGNRNRYLACVFQALRMEVNDEVGALKDFLTNSLSVLNEGGMIVIISYHSIEDRLVKNFFKTGNFEGQQEKDFYGNIHRPFKVITKKAITPTPQEVNSNPRSRSAKMRIARKQFTKST